MCSIANKHIAHHPSFSVIMNTCSILENLRPETPRPLFKKKKKIRKNQKFEIDRRIRDSLQKLSRS